MTVSLRTVRFSDLSEVISDAEALERDGYRSLGTWNLGQVCVHLSTVMRAFIEGFPEPPASARVPLWLTRNSIAQFARGRAMLTRTVTGSIATFPEMVPPAGVDDAEGLAELKDWIARTRAHSGGFEPSPSLGVLSAQEVEALHMLHCAHHLGFLVPLTNLADDGRDARA